TFLCSPHRLSLILRLPSPRPRAPRALHSFPTRRSSDLPVFPAIAIRPDVTTARAKTADRLSRAGRDSRGFLTVTAGAAQSVGRRSEEHTSELQSRSDLVCRLLLEKKNTT